MTFYIDTESALLIVWFNPQLVKLVGRFWVFFLSHTAPGFQGFIVVLLPPLHVGHLLGFSS